MANIRIPNIATIVAAGRLGRDPELGKTKSTGKAVCKWTIAIDQFKGREKTEPLWLRCVCYGDMAERAAKGLHKGDPVQVQGTLESYSGTARDGNAQTYFQVLVARFWPLAWPDEQGVATGASDGDAIPDDDIPF